MRTTEKCKMKALLSILLTMILTVSFGQSRLDIDSTWGNCFDSHAEIDEEAYAIHKSFCDASVIELVDLYQGNDSLVIATFFLGQLSFYNGQYEEAMTCFQVVQKMKFGKGIDENYKYSSTIRIAEIQIQRKDFSGAIKSLEKTKSKYRFSHFCGNGFSIVDYNFDSQMAEIEFQKGNLNAAIGLIEPYLFSVKSNSKNDAPNRLIRWLRNEYSENEIYSSLLKSLVDASSSDSSKNLKIPVAELNIGFEIPLDFLWVQDDRLLMMDETQVNEAVERKMRKTALFFELEQWSAVNTTEQR